MQAVLSPENFCPQGMRDVGEQIGEMWEVAIEYAVSALYEPERRVHYIEKVLETLGVDIAAVVKDNGAYPDMESA